ncbi:MAG: acyl-CoA thioesterase/bile acid-CoA:amino acid N-acyltransferase family protein [Pseudomonadota bacterium]
MKRRSLALAITALIAALAPAGVAQAQSFEVEATGTPGQNIKVMLADVPPGSEVEIRVQRSIKHYYRRGTPILRYQSAARFKADEDGRVDVTTSPSLGGSYNGIDPNGLFWSMQPVSEEAVEADDKIYFEALIAGTRVTSTSLELPMQPAAVEIIEIESLPGSFFAPHPGPGKHPTLILVDGPDTLGLSRAVEIPQLVEQGYSILYFATYSVIFGAPDKATNGLPTRYVDIPIDRLQEAYDWLAQQASVDTDRIGLYGFSRNGAYVVLAATRFEWIRAVAGISPSDVVWEGWGPQVRLGTTSSYSWKGEPLPYVPYSDNYFRETAKLARREPARLRTPMDEGRWQNPDRVAAARIPIESYRGSLFLAGGEQDNMWSAGHMVQNMVERRAEAGLKTEFLVLPDAGHNVISDGMDPTRLLEEGTARAAEAQAQSQTWAATIAFFNKVLKPGGS